jgi:hypothetical protein
LANAAVDKAGVDALQAIGCMPEGSARQRGAKDAAKQAVTDGKVGELAE